MSGKSGEFHTQGSGKTLTMVYAGAKLRRHPALTNPTVLIVVDRRDLKTQLADDFESCDYPNVEKALGVQDLKRRLRSDWRGTLVTTLQSFQQMGDLAPLARDNIISLVDEAHRSQKGKGDEGFAMTMRVKLPEAFRFGFTGTPEVTDDEDEDEDPGFLDTLRTNRPKRLSTHRTPRSKRAAAQTSSEPSCYERRRPLLAWPRLPVC